MLIRLTFATQFMLRQNGPEEFSGLPHLASSEPPRAQLHAVLVLLPLVEPADGNGPARVAGWEALVALRGCGVLSCLEGPAPGEAPDVAGRLVALVVAMEEEGQDLCEGVREQECWEQEEGQGALGGAGGSAGPSSRPELRVGLVRPLTFLRLRGFDAAVLSTLRGAWSCALGVMVVRPRAGA
jgi:hypothetical protein